MKAADVYPVLVKALETVGRLPSQELLARMNPPALARVVEIAGELVEFEIAVSWHDAARTSVRVTGHARGPSTWQSEHVQERIVVPLKSGG